MLLSRLESPASYASRRVNTSLKTRADFRASNGQIGTGLAAAGALFAEMEVICDATQEGQRQVDKFLQLCTATSVWKKSSGSQLPARIHMELEITVGTSPIRGCCLANSVLL